MSKIEQIEIIRQQTIVVNSFAEVDLSGLQCPIIAIHIKPIDYPEDVVARVYDLEYPTNIILIKKELNEVREDIMMAFPWMVRFDRAKNDLLSIAETWL